MKIAVTSQGPEWDSPVDPRFGRACGFIVFDADTDGMTYHDNADNQGAVQGAGIQASRKIVELGTRLLITGHVGPKAFATLQAGGVEVCTGADGTVREMIERWKAGQLETAEQPDRDPSAPS